MSVLVPLLAALAVQTDPPAPTLAEALAEGDAQWARRAEGAQGPVAEPGPIDRALPVYRRALALAPDSTEARWRLMRALFFRGAFCGAPIDVQKRLYEEAKGLAEEGVERAERSLGQPKGEARLAALKTHPELGPLYFWAGVSWGQWALVKGKVASAWEGAAGKIRDYAQVAIALAPEYEDGGGFILLGRLHDQAPKIPLLTPWVSKAQAIANLRRAIAINRTNSIAMYFLADVLLRREPASAAEARRLLADCAAVEPRPEYRVEDAHYSEMSRQRLAQQP